MNRLCVNIRGYGLIPVHAEEDYHFDQLVPQKIGDDTFIIVDEKREHVRLLKSTGMMKNALYLVRVK